MKVTFAIQFPELPASDSGYSHGIHLHSIECAYASASQSVTSDSFGGKNYEHSSYHSPPPFRMTFVRTLT